MNFGALTLLPAFLVIICAIKTRRTTESLLLGIVSSYIIIGLQTGESIISLINDGFFAVLTDYDTMWLVIVCGLFGSMIALMNEARGTHAIANYLGKICKSAKSTLFISWLLGIIIFVDDYMNIMTISACTKKLADKRKVPRESLAYVIDSTGAPVCVLLPFSTWAIFFAGVFFEQESVKALGYGNAMQTYLHIIPFIFYAIAAVFVVPMFILGVIPKIGAMKTAYDRVDKTGMVYSEKSSHLNPIGDIVESTTNSNICDFIIPIGIMITVQLVTDDMFIAIIASILVSALLYIPRKQLSLGKFCDLWINGFADTVPALAIIIAALFMRQASSDINLPGYVVELVQPYIGVHTYPLIAFVVVAALGFITGSNWGIPAVCAPIIIPLGASVGANLLLVCAAIVSGGTFCSHACFYSDATVITSNACDIDNMDHVYTQIPYAIISFALACVAYLICGFIF